MQPALPDPMASALAAILLHRNSHLDKAFGSLSGWRNSNPAPWPYEMRCENQLIELSLEQHQQDYCITLDCDRFQIQLLADQASDHPTVMVNTLTFVHEDLRQRCQYLVRDQTVFLRLGCRYYQYQDLTHAAAVSTESAGSGMLIASMDGSIVDVLVNEGELVSKGQTLVILEAMKMEHPLKASINGRVAGLSIKKGDQVKIRQPLVRIESMESAAAPITPA
jgi:geranyl-CoA carboxylase alpha subunit